MGESHTPSPLATAGIPEVISQGDGFSFTHVRQNQSDLR
jgi:hypothetical protein